MRAHFTASRLTVVAMFLCLMLASLWLAPQALAANPDGEIGQAVGTVDADTWRQVKNGGNSIDSRHDSNYSLIIIRAPCIQYMLDGTEIYRQHFP